MTEEILAGYAHLIKQHELTAKPLRNRCVISGTVKSKQEEGAITLFPRRAAPDTMADHLEFALKNEGVNLEVIDALFAKETNKYRNEIEHWIRNRPTSAYARRSAFLYEWLTGEQIDAPDTTSGGYIDLIDGDQFITSDSPHKESRFRINNNLIGNQQFCPMVRRTPKINALLGDNLTGALAHIRDSFPASIWERANEHFLLSETKSSFKIEREEPSESRARRFFRVLHEAGQGDINDDLLLRVQNAVVDKWSKETGYRNQQNWLGHGGRIGRFRATYIPPSPQDLPGLMDGWLDWIHSGLASPGLNPIVLAATASFGFVYLHPFMDGNGRTHRYLMHDILTRTGYFPEKTLIPVSAYMLKHEEAYDSTLKQTSNAIMSQLDYRLIGEYGQTIEIRSEHPARLYRYWDATDVVEFAYDAVSHTIRQDMPDELTFLRNLDLADRQINAVMDMPDKDRKLIVLMIQQNEYQLSNRKRTDFSYLPDEKIQQAEKIVRDIFLDQAQSAPFNDDDLIPSSNKAPSPGSQK